MKEFLLPFFFTLFSTVAFSQCLTIDSVTPTDVSCFGGNDGKITVTLASGVAPFTFELLLFQPGNGSSIMGSVTQSGTSVTFTTGNGTLSAPWEPFGIQAMSNYPPGSEYRISVSASGGGSPFCEIKTVTGITVDQPTSFVLNIDSTDPDCDATVGTGNGAIDISVSGGTLPYTIEWSGPTAIADNTLNASGLDAGTYTVLATDGNNCTTTQDIDIPIATIAAAGGDQDLCVDNTTLSANAPGAGEIGSWTLVSGSGTITDPASPTSTVTALGLGDNVFQWLIQDAGMICAGSADQVTITQYDPATVDAGPAQTICADGTVSLSGLIGGGAGGATWTSSGTGTFDNAASLTAIYTPDSDDLTAGTVTLTLTTDDPTGPCVSVNDDVVITINEAATVEAGPAQTICAGGTATMDGTVGGAAGSGAWTTSGNGSFDDDALATAVYTPGSDDIDNGTVTLTFTTDDPTGPCGPVSDDVVLTINAPATVEAGAAQTICEGSTVTLSGSVTPAIGVTWTTSGNGTFDDAASLAAIYTPSSDDLTAGTVTLTLTTDDPTGPCVPVNDDVVITIDEPATVEAGPTQTICADGTATMAPTIGGSAGSGTWTTSGNGSFDDAALATAVYTPGSDDITNGTVTLTFTTDDPAGPCGPVSDDVVLTINAPATVEAGAAQTICEGSTVTLSGSVTPAIGVTWTTSGNGTFDDAASLTAIYTPGTDDLTAGTVTLTLTTDDPTGPCVSVNDNVVITLDEPATVEAGPAQTICADGTATMAPTLGGSAGSGTWTTSGNGSFDDAALAAAVYTPGSDDITNGTVTLTFTTDDPAGPCGPVSDDVTITINAPTTINAGSAQTICEGSMVSLSASVTPAISVTWTTSGNGTFDDATSLTAIYTPGTDDLTAGTVTLTLTTDDPTGPCVSVNDNVVITIDKPATVEAGPTQSICSGETAILAGASVGGTATTGAWTIVSQPTSGDGAISDDTQTATPSAVTFTATVVGDYILRLTTDDPAGACDPATDDVVITITPAATVDAGATQTICVGQTASLNATFTAATGVTWTTSGDGSFDDPTKFDAIYTPGPNDITNGTVTLTATTVGPCAAVQDAVVITIVPVPTIDAGVPATICSDASIVLNGSFGGSATGLLWTTDGDGAFSDDTDPNAEYTPGTLDSTNQTVTLRATATGSCSGVFEDVVITVNPAATVDAGSPQTVCLGSNVTLDATLVGPAATSMVWSTSGDGSFMDATDPDTDYVPGANDLAIGTVTLTATTNNPTGPCPAAIDNVVISFIPIPGDQTTAGIETWIGYVYDDSGDPTPIPAKIDFDNTKYRGFISEADIDAMTALSTYHAPTDTFDLNLAIPEAIQGPNVCGSYVNRFSVRYKMNKTFAAGVYRFTVGADDGVRLLIDGVDILPVTAFALHSYTTYTSEPRCLTAGTHLFEIQYFDNTGQSRLTFTYEEVPALTTSSPVTRCVSSPAPTLSVSSTDVDAVDFNWYKDGTLVFTGSNYTPGATELDMATAGTTNFTVTAVYDCGETPPVTVVVDVVDEATLTVDPQTICEAAGIVDLLTLVNAVPAGGTFTFSGHPNIAGNNFDPAGLSGNTIGILVDYATGSCNAPQGTLNLTITNTAAINAPTDPVLACENSGDIDLSTLVSASPAGGTFTFSGTQVTGNTFDPSGLSGIQTITADYNLGGCVAPQITFDIDVTANATLVVNNATACQNGSPMNLLTLVSPTPAGGTFTFTGAGVSGNLFDPSAQSGTVTIDVDYDFNGCTAIATLEIDVLNSTDPLCTAGNCAWVTVMPPTETRPTCANQNDGTISFNVSGGTPPYIFTLSDNEGFSQSIPGPGPDFTFSNLSPADYFYTIQDNAGNTCTLPFSLPLESSVTATADPDSFEDVICHGSSTGSVVLEASGSRTGDYYYSIDGSVWIPFLPGNRISNLPPNGTYYLLVGESEGDVCRDTAKVVIKNAFPPMNVDFNITPATCNGNDGAITGIVASGGNDAPFTYSIDAGQSYQSETSFEGLPGGSYTLRVRDAGGCEMDFAADVTFPGFVNSAISKNNADCSNGGDSGSISVVVNEPGSFEVAISTDQFNAPVDGDYLPYSTPSVTFDALSRGEYYVYVRSTTGSCPTRSAPIRIFGVYDITFDLQADCNNNALSLALLNVTGESGGAPLEIQISKVLSSDPPEIIYQQFPADGEVYLDHDQFDFLQTPGEYRLKVIQFQNEVVCNLPSETFNFTVPEPLSAQIASVSESYPDVPTGKILVSGFSGGVYPFDVRIELDSAASFALPYHATDFQEAGVNANQQIEMPYDNVPAGRYKVEVMDSQGCVIDLTARVPLDVDLFIPNIFTPNNDGSNDVFFVRNLPQEPAINELIITNRWGKQVFVSENYQNNWDGEGVADGIYFYRLQIADSEALTGWIEILRGQKP